MSFPVTTRASVVFLSVLEGPFWKDPRVLGMSLRNLSVRCISHTRVFSPLGQNFSQLGARGVAGRWA